MIPQNASERFNSRLREIMSLSLSYYNGDASKCKQLASLYCKHASPIGGAIIGEKRVFGFMTDLFHNDPIKLSYIKAKDKFFIYMNNPHPNYQEYKNLTLSQAQTLIEKAPEFVILLWYKRVSEMYHKICSFDIETQQIILWPQEDDADPHTTYTRTFDTFDVFDYTKRMIQFNVLISH
jgi:hypothetical protein